MTAQKLSGAMAHMTGFGDKAPEDVEIGKKGSGPTGWELKRRVFALNKPVRCGFVLVFLRCCRAITSLVFPRRYRLARLAAGWKQIVRSQSIRGRPGRKPTSSTALAVEAVVVSLAIAVGLPIFVVVCQAMWFAFLP